MNYQAAIDYLFNAAPLFQNIGAGAYKEGLSNTYTLDAHFGHPHQFYRTIHVGGTNGKGSVSHTLAAILQSSGLRVGLYTSPHLIDFRERIRVNGEMIPQKRVIQFVEEERSFFEPLHPSFFELATALAFKYFQEQKVDVAVIEVGLGGRLDCTNIIHPDLSIITNISFDHVQFLGDTLEKIAHEKAGIIKKNIPAILGETGGNKGVKRVFEEHAKQVGTSLHIAEDEDSVTEATCLSEGGYLYTIKQFGILRGQLGGYCQDKNTRTIISAVSTLKELGYNIGTEDIKNGVQNVCELTGLMGRWQTLRQTPRVICDTGHNVGGMQYITKQLNSTPHRLLHIIIGMVNDKDVSSVLTMLPKDAKYYFTQASVKRALPAEEFQALANKEGLQGKSFLSVADAYKDALKNATKDDLIFIGGSTFIVADMLKSIV